jgi:hypothetical protein
MQGEGKTWLRWKAKVGSKAYGKYMRRDGREGIMAK